MREFLVRTFAKPAERLMALSGPSLYWLLVFFALPLTIMMVISVAQRGPYGTVLYKWSWADYHQGLKTQEPGATEPAPAPSRLGYGRYLMQNYERAFDPLYLQIYWRSVLLALLTTILCLLLGYPIAYYIALKVPASWRNFCLILVIIPFWTSFLVRTYAWILLLRNDGLINNFFLHVRSFLDSAGFAHSFTWFQPPFTLLYNNFAVLVGLVYGELPFMILPLYSTIQKLDTSLLEACADLGATPRQAFFRVTLPLTRPGIIAGTIFVFIPSIGAFVIPDLMGGSKAIMVGNLIQNQFAVTRDLPFGAAVCFLLTVLVLSILWVHAAATGQRSREHF
jgi:spermidine/putrescine transport system permease protein